MSYPSNSPDPAASPVDIWSLAQCDYMGGETAAVVAERYGLSERSLQRKAAAEGWRRADATQARMNRMPPWARRATEHLEALLETPEMQPVHSARQAAKTDLLVAPDPTGLRLFAFRQAAECAAMGQPAQAVLWMRLVQQVDRCGDRVDQDDAAFPEADYLRAAYKAVKRASKATARSVEMESLRDDIDAVNEAPDIGEEFA